MKAYIEIIRNSFLTGITYRVNTLLRIFGAVVSLLVQISVWYVLFKSKPDATSHIGAIKLSEMVTYTIVSTLTHIIISNQVITRLNNKIKTGQIAMDLIKPMSLKAIIGSEMIGGTLYNVIFRSLPILFIGIFLFSFQFSGWLNLAFFIIALFNAAVIFFELSYIVGLAGFWYITIWHMGRVLDNAIRVFGGSFIPLWFFPESLYHISMFLPFRFIYYTPILIYIGKVDMKGVIEIILQQWVWIAILIIIEKIIWKFGIKKLVIQGG